MLTAPTVAPDLTPVPTLPISVAVRVGSPTPTPQIVGDYATEMRPKLQGIQHVFGQLEQQLASAEKTPLLMAEDDWRNQTDTILETMLADSADARTLDTRLGAPDASITKLLDDVDFVGNEFHMAFSYDPDATHFMRAGRAERTTRDELDSILTTLR